MRRAQPASEHGARDKPIAAKSSLNSFRAPGRPSSPTADPEGPLHLRLPLARPETLEHDLERGIIDHPVARTQKGFASFGSQCHHAAGGQDYYLDFLFYHLRPRCFVAIELNIQGFTHRNFARKSEFYPAVDDQLRHQTISRRSASLL
ncbi:PDDEXK nuclease domain-containing protein [Bradyrhizobium sp. 131]|uniref:PDDEXK nuclease domain-containing protein n=1 Tax=Bradyrhizobium sp. 131 TaxID=2782609 RepID=UPI001FFFD84B|nr:PDDEXK nuclease domain-containing protein [Bradyrhizobium sp. 131]